MSSFRDHPAWEFLQSFLELVFWPGSPEWRAGAFFQAQVLVSICCLFWGVPLTLQEEKA